MSHNKHNPVNQSRSPIGRRENCVAYRKSLHDPQPLIFGCTTSIKPQKPGKPTCDAHTSVLRLTRIFGLFQVVKRFCMECDRGLTFLLYTRYSNDKQQYSYLTLNKYLFTTMIFSDRLLTVIFLDNILLHNCHPTRIFQPNTQDCIT